MLGIVAVVLGIGFVLIGVNGLTIDPSKRPPPVPGTGSADRNSGSLASRRVVSTAWIVVGVLFVAGAFAHLVP